VVVRQYFYEKSETESGSADFFMNPSESVRLQDFGIRNNTKNLHKDSISISGFTLSHLQKIPGLFQDFPEPQNVFPGLCHSPAVFKYTNSSYLLCIYV